MHHYPHHIGDFIRDTARLSDSQCMAYLRMIWHYYETEQPIENDVDAIAFRFGANASDVHQILKHYFFMHEGHWHNSRCDKEILAFRSKSEKAKESANARWENAKAMRTHSERNADEPISDANHKPITNNHKPIEKPISRKIALDDFNLFWKAYPKKVGKTAAIKAWGKAKPDLESVLKAIKWQRASEQWKADGGKYIPNPATYINQGRWQDEPPEKLGGGAAMQITETPEWQKKPLDKDKLNRGLSMIRDYKKVTHE